MAMEDRAIRARNMTRSMKRARSQHGYYTWIYIICYCTRTGKFQYYEHSKHSQIWSKITFMCMGYGYASCMHCVLQLGHGVNARVNSHDNFYC